ncbi:helix-hairpin-helix domain-containing protein [Lysinibacillus sp. 54212]|uniref:helix-hairpin-helix domain-containing protein n=1 Tax=Lysinibacillus sp. 54212 TaxID=3119829 RepID=UPI002FC8DE9B
MLQKYGKRVLFPSILCVIGLIIFLLSQDEPAQTTFEPVSSIPEQQIIETNEKKPDEPVTAEPLKALVDVKGAVKYPGVYELTTEHRVVDAIEQAGGYVDKANPNAINHAQKLQDEMVIYIPLVGEDTEALETMITATGTPSSQETSSGKVNLNKAEEAELTTLPGIGPAKAQAILAYRQENGGFKTIEDLKEVTGIGDKTFEKLKDSIDIK